MTEQHTLHTEIDLGTEPAPDEAETNEEPQGELTTDGYHMQYVDPNEYHMYMNNPEYQQQLAEYNAYMYREFGYVYDGTADYHGMSSQTAPANMSAPPTEFKMEVMVPSPMMAYNPSYDIETKRPASSYKQHSPMAGIKRKSTSFFLNATDEEILPDELKKLFRPLSCELCKVKMNSPISATMHYQSKVHDRKVTQWLENWSKSTGNPMPHRAKRTKIMEGPRGNDALHCQACDLPLTSIQHANQHYMGKKHRLVVQGKSSPSGQGFYKDGKWMRMATAGKVDPTGRFGIGTQFMGAKKYDQKDFLAMKKNATTQNIQMPPPPGTENFENENFFTAPPPPPPQEVSSTTSDHTMANFYKELNMTKPPEKQLPKNPKLYCPICEISVTSDMVMQSHLAGTKHAKKVKAMGTFPPPPISNRSDTLLSNINTPVITDYSIYRTPSGQFYCKFCDLTVADENLFTQHIGSKKHKKNHRNE